MSSHDFESTTQDIAELLVRAMEDSDRPVAELCAALTRMGESLDEWRKSASGSDAATGFDNAVAESCRRKLESDIAICIESLQFHDRLIQQLSAARKRLLHATNPDAEPTVTRPIAGGSVELF